LLGYVVGDWLQRMKDKNETEEETRLLAAKAINMLGMMIMFIFCMFAVENCP